MIDESHEDSLNKVAQETPDVITATKLPAYFLILVFGFGLAAGFSLAFSGLSLERSAELIIIVFLTLVAILCLVGAIVFLFRKQLLGRAFGLANAQMEQFAGPITRVAEGAVERDTAGTTTAARDLLHLAFARYAWLSTRRWIIASLTALIAAMAALSGTALLFQQNQLLVKQSDLLRQQNEKIGDQTDLLKTQVELAEAARNAGLAVEMVNIAALLGEALDVSAERAVADNAPTNVDKWAEAVPVLDALSDIDQSLRMRIISASHAFRPYRFLLPDQRAHDDIDKLRKAGLRRKDELPRFYNIITDGYEPPLDHEPKLIDRLASPERAQLLQILMSSGLRDLELLNFYGFEMAFAYGPDMTVLGLSAQGASLSYASLERSQITGSDFGGADLINARFDGARIERTKFRSIFDNEAKGPYAQGEIYLPTQLAGTSFRNTFLRDVPFEQINAMIIDFDGATLHGVNFSGAVLAGATFRGAVLLDVNFEGAALQSVDLDGAFVVRSDFLEYLQDTAAPGTFKSERFAIKEATIEQLMEVSSAYKVLEFDEVVAIAGGQKIWQITRVGEFEQP